MQDATKSGRTRFVDWSLKQTSRLRVNREMGQQKEGSNKGREQQAEGASRVVGGETKDAGGGGFISRPIKEQEGL